MPLLISGPAAHHTVLSSPRPGGKVTVLQLAQWPQISKLSTTEPKPGRTAHALGEGQLLFGSAILLCLCVNPGVEQRGQGLSPSLAP